ncbi:MAG TPA: aminotransferase class V-fold PLP-dependent enzyme [Thermoanaerobacterales bacterium]|nr:aminotransferase class V-fold PLP-dependent enzyme [Thermoanaerobacterales bacterium]
MIYFDNAATTWPKPECVCDAVVNTMKKYGANPGRSGHSMALSAARIVYEARELLAAFFNAESSRNIVFTSNATEALNMAIKGVLKPGDHVITSSMEHNSVARPLFALQRMGVEWDVVKCDLRGMLDPDDVKKAIKPNTRLIAMTHASNLTGTILPVEEVGKIARERGILFLVDAAQTAGIIPIDVQRMNIDLLAFPGHKGLYGPQGTGGLYVRETLDITPIKEGGTGSLSEHLEQPQILPDRLESGTLNTPGIAGLAAGIRFITQKGIENIRAHEQKLAGKFLEGLKHRKDISLYGPGDPTRMCAVVSLNVGELDSSELAYLLDSRCDIQVRPGLHCTPLAHKTIGTWERGAVRFSFSVFNTEDEVDEALRALDVICQGY